MPCYVTRDAAIFALQKMRIFYQELEALYVRNELNIKADIGRRNILMSSLQEKYFAEGISQAFPGTVANGKTGEPDIIVAGLNRELECKLTSRNRSGSWALQSDYNTLRRKGAVDHLYALASDDFNEFAVLFFEGLTIDDFRPPAPGSKGKSRINFSKAIHKSTVIVGNMEDKSLKYTAAAIEVLENPASSRFSRGTAKERLEYWRNRSRISFNLETI